MKKADVQKFYDNNARQYLVSSSQNWYEKHVNWPSVQALMGKVEGNVLEFGCAGGYYLAQVPIDDDMKFGADLSPRLIESAKKSHPKISFYVWDGHTSPPFSRRFSAIFSKLVLHFVDDLHPIARNWHDMLEDKGEAIISVPHPYDTAKRLNGNYGQQAEYTTELRGYGLSSPMIHRSFEGWLEPFLEQGFQLTAISEPLVSKAQAEQLGGGGRGWHWPIRFNFKLTKI